MGRFTISQFKKNLITLFKINYLYTTSFDLHLSNNKLLHGLKSGDRVIVESIYADIFPKVKSWVLNNKGKEEDAYDIFQEVLETILLKIDSVHTTFEGLVMQIAKYKWIDKIRKAKTVSSNNDFVSVKTDTENTIDDSLIEKERDYLKYKLLDNYFTQLSPICQALMLKVKKGMSVDKIVYDLEFKSANTMYRRKAACIERWSKLIKQDKNYSLLND